MSTQNFSDIIFTSDVHQFHDRPVVVYQDYRQT